MTVVEEDKVVDRQDRHDHPIQPFDHLKERYERKGRLRSVSTPRGIQIWQCIDKTNGEEECSMKVIKKTAIKPSKFLMEIAILKECNGHPNLLHIRDVYQDDKFYYVVTDNLDQPNVLQTLEGLKSDSHKKVGPTLVATIIRHLMNALTFCHDPKSKSMKSKKQIIHGNIHPKNILIPKGQSLDDLILVDFSSAIMEMDGNLHQNSDDEDDDNDNDSDDSSQKKHRGKSQFHAPEFSKTGPTEKTDLWAVGVLTFLLLTGCYPFSKPSDMANEIQDWKGIRDPNCQKFIAAMLSYNPKKRPSAKDINKESVWFNSEAELVGTMYEADLGEVMHRLTTINREHEFQVAVRSYIATRVLQKSDRDHLDQIFRLADQNNNNNLSRKEFQQALIRADIDFLDKDAIDSYFKLLDVNHDHRISYTEFMAFVEDQELLFEQKRLRAAFDAFDYDKSGSISAKDIMKFSNSAGGASAFQGETVLKEKTIQSMIDRADKNGNATISFGEFCDMMLGQDKARLV